MLYSASRDSGGTFPEIRKQYRDNIQRSYQLYLFNMLYLTKIAEYAVHDGVKRKAKHLPTADDKVFTDKLFTNELVQALLNESNINSYWDREKFRSWVDEDNVRQLYQAFLKTEHYQKYNQNNNPTVADHKSVLLELFKFCVASESYDEIMSDLYWSWDDDRSLIIGTMKKTIKALPNKVDFFEANKPDEEATIEFGETLLSNVYHKGEELLAVIEPTLKNWDADRVAILDMIILKMALSELTAFPSIPTKVTLNEFVEVAKMYSTDKSKDFINGILDRLMKKLNKEGKINKEGRGLIG
ncbi:MAG: transcription antitermination factor NusB [Saprospiraceae bacterium]